MTAIPDPLVHEMGAAPPGAHPRWLPAVAIGAGVLLAFAAGLLWATQGAEVFLAAVLAGIAACF